MRRSQGYALEWPEYCGESCSLWRSQLSYQLVFGADLPPAVENRPERQHI